MKPNYGIKIAVGVLFFIMMTTSIAQAAVTKDGSPIKIIRNQTMIESLHGGRDTDFWHDDFVDSSKIDSSPPGTGQTDHYQIQSGQVVMTNTYTIWTDPTWTRMKVITITNNEGQSLVDYPLKLVISYDADMQSDYDDICFKFQNNPGTWLNYWIQSYDTLEATVWVKIPSLSTGQSMLYLFYGKPSATSQSDFNGVFSGWENEWSNDVKISNHATNEGAWDPDVAFGSDRFFVAWEEGTYVSIKQEIRGTIFNSDGSVVPGAEDFLIFCAGGLQYRDENPSIAYGGGKFFVAWEHYGSVLDDDTKNIKGRFVTTSGGLPGDSINICWADHCQADPVVTFDTQNSRFCVVWEDGRDSNPPSSYLYDIRASLYDTNGNVVVDQKAITDNSNSQTEPWVAFNPETEQYLIVYEDAINPAQGPFSIKAQLCDENLNTIGSPVTIAVGTTNTDYNFPCVAYSEEADKYLVTYNDGDISDEDWYGNVWGAILDDTGQLDIAPFQIKSGSYIRTDIVPYFEDAFLVSYDDQSKIYGKLVGSDGTIISDDIQLSASSSAEADWANIALGNNKIFVTWEDERITTYTKPDAYGNVWWLNSTTSSQVNYLIGLEKELVLSAHVTSIEIEPSNIKEWYQFTTMYAGGVTFSILDGTGAVLLDPVYPGQGIQSLSASSIRLMATFSRPNPSSTPSLDWWDVSWEINNPPNVPSNPSPANGATSVGLDADLSWTGGDPDGDSVTYDVYFGTSSPPPQVSCNQTQTTYDPGTLSFYTTYYWQIVAEDSYGATTAGPVWSFTTRINNPPNTPSNPYPPNGAVNVNLDVDVSWSGGDPDGDAVTYDVYFGTSSSPPKVTTNQSGATYDPGTLNYNTLYYWKIVAWDEHGATSTGPLWSFTTRVNHPPNVPSNPSPANGAINVNTNADLSWTGGDPDPGDTVTYDIYFGTTNPPPILVYGHTTTSYDPGLMTHSTIYYWKIVAWDSFGESATGPVWQFTTIANSPPYVPSNPSPANGATNVDTDVTLTWTGGDPNGDPVTYDVYFGTSTTPSKVSANQSGTFYDPGTLAFGTTYYWKIVSWDTYGASATGPLWSFTTKINNPPNTPSNPAPANGASNVDPSADLSWSGGDPDGDTVTYDVYFGTSNPPPKVVTNQSATTYDPGTLAYSTTYYWKIVAWDEHGASAIGPVWNFATKTNNPPNVPFNPHPAHGSTNVATTTDLSWSGGDPDGDDVTYDVYFGTTSTPSKVAANQTATTYDSGTMNTNTTYYWKIVAWDEQGEKASGPLWEFTTIEQFNNPPNTPSIWGTGSFIPGVEFVQPNVEYTFSVVTSDSDGDDVYYWVDWGDDTNTGWLGPYSTSIEQTVSHTWSQPLSLQFVKVKAKDAYGAESGWGYLVVIVNQQATVLKNIHGVTVGGTTQQQSQPVSGQGITSTPLSSPGILRTIQTKPMTR